MSQKESFGGQSRMTEEEPVGYRLGNESRGRQAAGSACKEPAVRPTSRRDHTDVVLRSLSTSRQHDSIRVCVESSATSAL